MSTDLKLVFGKNLTDKLLLQTRCECEKNTIVTMRRVLVTSTCLVRRVDVTSTCSVQYMVVTSTCLSMKVRHAHVLVWCLFYVCVPTFVLLLQRFVHFGIFSGASVHYYAFSLL